MPPAAKPVGENTAGGDAESGDANALVNILNLINSGISAGDSFLGVININGNFNGDILLPEKLLLKLIQLVRVLNTITENQTNTINATIVDNKSILNNTDLRAESGQADVSSNTNAGSATTGQANTKIKRL